MKKLRKWFLLAGTGLILAACGSSDTDEPVVAAALATPEPTVSVHNSTATVRWRSVENAQQYAWELLKGTEATPQTGNCFSSTYSFEMAEGAIYSFRVKALPLSGSAWAASAWSEYVVASSNMLAAPRPALVAESLTDTAAELSWPAVEEAASYKYELYEMGVDRAVKSASQSELRVVFSDLKAGTSYRFRAMAVSASELKNDSAWSEYVDFVTRKVEALAAPVVKVAATTAQGASLTWGAVQNAVEYAYELYDTTIDGASVKSGKTSDTDLTFNDLKELNTYYFHVKALPAADNRYALESAFSDMVSFRTRSAASQNLNLGLPAHEQDGVIRAFPGAEGAGMYTTGGRGGKVIHVTNLNDSGAGSLRAAVQQSGARVIVFDVAGTITLKSSLKIQYPNITIAGQTAPGDGICLRGYGVDVAADNVIIRYLRIRPGDENGNDGLDALGGRYMENIIIDHCSLSWSTDECVSFYVNRNMTMQYCLAYESLRNGKHNKGTHGYGGIWGGAPASFHHNILAHHDSRNPRFDSPEQYGDGPTPGATATAKKIFMADRLMDFRNNVVYNFCNFPGYGGVGLTLNYVGNYYKWGPASYNGTGPSYKMSNNELVKTGSKNCRREYFFACDTYYDNNGVDKTPEKYVSGNQNIYCDNSNVLDTSVGDASKGAAVTADNKKGFIAGTTSGKSGSCPFNPVWSSTPYEVRYGDLTCYATTHSAQESFEVLTRYCGACLRQDAADARVLADVKNGTGTSGKAGETTATGLERSWNGLIDTPDDKGGYPTLTATPEELLAVVDTDGDGIPDDYEDLFGLDRNNAADGAAKTLDPQGLYSNLEIYLHYLVKDITAAQTATGTYAKIK